MMVTLSSEAGTRTRKLWRSASRAAVSMVSSQVGRPLITFQMHFITRTQYLHTTN